MTQAKVLYPKARVYYERIEPVAEVWGSLDTEHRRPVGEPGHGGVPVHRLPQDRAADLGRTTRWPARRRCAARLVRHEQQLLTLVRSAQYNPLEMASGATDLINEAATSKITGEEERYSNTDLPVFQANVDGVDGGRHACCSPTCRTRTPAWCRRSSSGTPRWPTLLAKYKASPGYDDTGYVEYSTVLDVAAPPALRPR